MTSRRSARALLLAVVAAALISTASAHQPLEEQVHDLSARIARDPRDASLYLARGERRRLLHEWGKARSDFSRARRLDPNLATVDLCEGLLMLDTARPERALVYLDRYLARAPDRVDGLVARGRARVAMGRYLDGAEDYTRAIAQYSGDDLPRPEQYLDRARALAAAGEDHIEEALAGLDAGLERLGSPPTLQLLAIDLEIRRGRKDLAEVRRARLSEPATAPDEPSSQPSVTALPVEDGAAAAAGRTASPPSIGRAPAHARSINAVPRVVRGPYLQSGTPRSLIVRWRTDTPSNSRVQYGSAPGHLATAVDSAASTTEHVVAVTGLQPATKYYYSIGSTTDTLAGDDADHFFFTSPPAGTPQPSRIWVLGDSGTADSSSRMVKDAYETFTGATHTNLWLMLGDNAYPDGTDAEYQAAVFDVYPRMLAKSVLWPTLGNHDGHSASSSSQSGPYYDIFSLPARGEAGGVVSGTEAYYAFDYANIHFICLDSYDLDRSPGGAMMTWLRQDLAATRQDWVIAFWHHPPYSKGSHDSDTESELIDMRENALPILEGTGVDLVLTGHSHDYERSFLLDGHYGTSDTLLPSMKIDPGSGRIAAGEPYAKPTPGPAPHEGAVYVVAGSSGQTGGGQLNHPAMYLSLSTLGSLVLDVDGGELHATFLDSTGAARDDFTILKGQSLPPVASAGADVREECTGPGGAQVLLDGSFSSDPDSSPGTNDDIVRFQWFEDYGLPSQKAIGMGESLSAQLAVGSHRITLKVTDRAGLASTDDLAADVVDTAPPTISVVLSPHRLWPPDHHLVDIDAHVRVGDLCGKPARTLISIVSSEPDDAIGPEDGRTTGDIRGATFGSADFHFKLRAERDRRSSGRTYTVTYRATDSSGNAADASGTVVVRRARASSQP